MLLLLCCLGLLIPGGKALANGVPPRWVGDQGGLLVPGRTEQVHVLRERLRFDLLPEYRAANVTAEYDMENRGGELRSFQVAFVIQDTSRGGESGPVHALWNGQPLAVAESESGPAEAMAAWEPIQDVIDPVSRERYSIDTFFGNTRLRFARFALDLPAGAKGTLTVSYRQRPATDADRRANVTYHYQYLLTPAKGWASFGPVEIRVALPEGESSPYFATTIPMQQEEREYVASLPGLPQENLAFAVMSREGLLLGMTDPGAYFWLAFVLVLLLAIPVGLGAGWLTGGLKSKGFAVTLGVGVGLVGGGLVNGFLTLSILSAMPLEGQGYGVALIGVGQWLVTLAVSSVAAGVAAARRPRKKYVAAA